jgi:hypothetical protein
VQKGEILRPQKLLGTVNIVQALLIVTLKALKEP